MATKYVKELELMHALRSYKIVLNRLKKTFKMTSQYISFHFFKVFTIVFFQFVYLLLRQKIPTHKI